MEHRVPNDTNWFGARTANTSNMEHRIPNDTNWFGAPTEKQVEAPAKQGRFRCWSASKTMNAHCHTRRRTGHTLEATPPPSPVCKGWVVSIPSTADSSTEERARRYSEIRSRSNVSGAYTILKDTNVIKHTFEFCCKFSFHSFCCWGGTPMANLNALLSMLCSFFRSVFGAEKYTSWP